MARSDKTHEQRILDLEVEFGNFRTATETVTIFITNALNAEAKRLARPRTFWQKLNDYFAR